jgi:hypothetical protein
LLATILLRIACSAALKPAGLVAVLGPHRLPNLGFAGAGLEVASLLSPFEESDVFKRLADDLNVRRMVKAVKEGFRPTEPDNPARCESYNHQ